jgi:hypothetical protein
MRRAYLLIFIPALIVGVCYFAVFHGLGYPISPVPFLAAAGAVVAAVILVRYYLHRHMRRPGR